MPKITLQQLNTWFEILGDDVPAEIGGYLIVGLEGYLLDLDEDTQRIVLQNCATHYKGLQPYIALNMKDSDNVVGNYVMALLTSSYQFMKGS